MIVPVIKTLRAGGAPPQGMNVLRRDFVRTVIAFGKTNA